MTRCCSGMLLRGAKRDHEAGVDGGCRARSRRTASITVSRSAILSSTAAAPLWIARATSAGSRVALSTTALGMWIDREELRDEVCAGTVGKPQIEQDDIDVMHQLAGLGQRRCLPHDLEVHFALEQHATISRKAA